MSEFASAIDPSEWYARLQRAYLATTDEAVLDQLTDIGRLLAVTGVPLESVLEAHGAVLAKALRHADPQRHDDVVQASSICLSQVMVAWRIAAEGLADSGDVALPQAAVPPVFLTFDRDGGLAGDPSATTLHGKLASLGVACRAAEVGEAVRQRRLMTFDVHPADTSDQVLHAVLCPFHDGSGLLCIHDVSARRAAAEAQFQRRKLASLGQLAGGIAHEINNLLQPILSAAQFIGEDHAGDAELMGDVQIIIDSARSAANVVRDVLAFARRTASDLTPMNLAHAVEREMETILRAAPLRAEVKIQALAAPVIRANAGELAQVLRNLVGNAAEAALGRVVVSVAAMEIDQALAVQLSLPAGPYARLSVADDGPGISAETARHIFEPFFTTKEVGKGTGLGLAIVRGIVHGWGGAIALRQDAPAGAVFDVFVPVSDMVVAEREPIAGPMAQGVSQGTRVVVVDDDDIVREMIARILERDGHVVRSFSSAKEALGHFETGDDIGLLLSDWMMPGMDGFAFVKEIRRRRAHLPVLMLTGGGDGSRVAELQRSAAELGIGEVLFKPVAGPQLLMAVRRCLEHPARAGRDKDMPEQRQVEAWR
ncbi:MAG: response regulator [Bacteroidales bacterium]